MKPALLRLILGVGLLLCSSAAWAQNPMPPGFNGQGKQWTSGSTCPPTVAPVGGAGGLYTCSTTGALYTFDGATWTAVGSGGGGTPASPDTAIQFNNSGSFGANAHLTWNGASVVVGEASGPVGTPTVTGPGTSYSDYYIVAFFADGTHTASGWSYPVDYVDVNNGPDSYDASHFVTLNWPAVPGAVSYKIYTDFRTGTDGADGLLGTTSMTTFVDDGIVGDGNPVYAPNNSGSLVSNSVLLSDATVTNQINAYRVQFGTTAGTWVGVDGASFTLNRAISDDANPEIAITESIFFGSAVDRTKASIGGDIATTFDGTGGIGVDFPSSGGDGYSPTNRLFRQFLTSASFPNGAWNTYHSQVLDAVTNVAGLRNITVWPPSLVNGSTVADYEGVWIAAIGGSATNAYSFWSDEQGVFRIRADNTFNAVYQAIPALYNPQFTKYTPGAANYERIVTQWESNVAVLTTEKGGSGTLRAMQFGDAGVSVGFGGSVADIPLGNGNAIKGDTTSGHTYLLQGYDTDTGPGYVTFGTVTNGTAPGFVLTPPAGGATVSLTANALATAGTTAVAVANVGANSCGTTTATIAGNDSIGEVTVGATAATQCRVAFTVAAATRRECVITDATTTIATRAVYVDSTHSDFLGAFVAGDAVAYVCLAR